MHSSRSLARGLALGVAVVLAVAVAACGSSSNTQKPSAGTSGPSSLVDNFKSQATKSDFQFEGPLTGSISISAGAANAAGQLTGTAKGKGQDSAMSITITIAGTTQVQDQITVGDSTYRRTNGGSWAKTARFEASLADLFGAGMKIEDKGVETKFGQQLHRLEPTNMSEIDLAALGLTGISGTTNMKISLIVWVKDDGTPAGMNQGTTYDMDSGGAVAHVTMSTDISFDRLSGVTIEAPSI